MSSPPKLIRRTDQKASDGHHYLYEFRCPYCGDTFSTRLSYVRDGTTRSCGCLAAVVAQRRKHYRDYTGQCIGQLHVEAEAGVADDGHVLWQCLCECGTAVVLPSDSVKKGSCGCQTQRKRRLKYLKRFKDQICK